MENVVELVARPTTNAEESLQHGTGRTSSEMTWKNCGCVESRSLAHIIAVATLSARASDSAGMCLRFVFLPPYAPWSDAMLRGERYDAAECDGSAASDDEICCGDTWQIERCADPARIPVFSLSFHGPKMAWRNGCENAATSTRAETRVVTVSHTLPHALRSDPERFHTSQAVPSGPERSRAVPSGPKRSQAVPRPAINP